MLNQLSHSIGFYILAHILVLLIGFLCGVGLSTLISIYGNRRKFTTDKKDIAAYLISKEAFDAAMLHLTSARSKDLFRINVAYEMELCIEQAQVSLESRIPIASSGITYNQEKPLPLKN